MLHNNLIVFKTSGLVLQLLSNLLVYKQSLQYVYSETLKTLDLFWQVKKIIKLINWYYKQWWGSVDFKKTDPGSPEDLIQYLFHLKKFSPYYI